MNWIHGRGYVGYIVLMSKTTERDDLNGNNRNNELKYLIVTEPDGFAGHDFGPIEGRRNDWDLHAKFL